MKHAPKTSIEIFRSDSEFETSTVFFELDGAVSGRMETREQGVVLNWQDRSAVDALANALQYGAINGREYTMFTADGKIKRRRPLISSRWAARQIRSADLGYNSLVSLYASDTVRYTIENNDFTSSMPEMWVRSDDWQGAFADARVLADYGPSENAALVAANQEELVHRYINS